MASGLGRGICDVLVFSEGGEAMTKDEQRQALREKHRPTWKFLKKRICLECGTYYPCDVIKVLDVTEGDPDCTHVLSWTDYLFDGEVVSFEVANEEQHRCDYCPRCGEKL